MLTGGHVYTGSGQESLAAALLFQAHPLDLPLPSLLPSLSQPLLTTVWHHLKTSS